MELKALYRSSERQLAVIGRTIQRMAATINFWKRMLKTDQSNEAQRVLPHLRNRLNILKCEQSQLEVLMTELDSILPPEFDRVPKAIRRAAC